MAPRKNIPDGYISRWNANSPYTSSLSSAPSPETATPAKQVKYNSSCNNCKKARVRCSGGNPCDRCQNSTKTPACVYSVSQRRGQRKADGTLLPGSSKQQSSSMQPSGDLAEQTALGNLAAVDVTGLEPYNMPWTTPQASMDQEYIESPISNDFSFMSADMANFLNPLPILSPPVPPIPKGPAVCFEQCHLAVHGTTNRLAHMADDPREYALDQILQVFDDAFTQAAKYLACEKCDAGCHRLATISLLHQRQLNLIVDIAKNPSKYLDGDTTFMSLGAYQIPKNTSLVVKRLLLVRVSENIEASMDEWRKDVQSFMDNHDSGVKKLSEGGLLNMQWMLDTAKLMQKRLGCVQSLLACEKWSTKE